MSASREFACVDDLVCALKDEADAPDDCHRLLACARLGQEEIERFCHYRESYYTRNLIERNDRFELMTLCWLPGQITPIHDHAGSHGWSRCLAGELEEVRYHWRDVDGLIEVEEFERARARAGDQAYINDDIGLHTIACVGDQPAISLHLYTPVIQACQYYRPQAKCFEIKQLSYYTIDGQLV